LRVKPISEVLRVAKGIVAHRVIDYLKERNYSASLAKLQHEVRDRNYRYSLWQTEKNVFPIYSEKLFMQKVKSFPLSKQSENEFDGDTHAPNDGVCKQKSRADPATFAGVVQL